MTTPHACVIAPDGQGVLRGRFLLLCTAALMMFAGQPASAETPTPIAASISQPVPSGTPPCPNADKLARLDQPLARTASRLMAGQPIKIVAIGSSSTAGAGASTQAASYPSRLAADLTRRFRPGQVNVVNRGVNGEEAQDMLARFDTDVLAENPDLVLWQVGTNALLRDHFGNSTESAINVGIRRLKVSGADVILVDSQFAPKVLAKPRANELVERLAAIAKQENVLLFRRYAMMRQWHVGEGIGFDTFVSSDGLHMNDWSYGCFAKALGAAIAEAATRPTATAAARPPR